MLLLLFKRIKMMMMMIERWMDGRERERIIK